MGLYGGVEAGGTKFVCVVGTAPDDILASHRVPTGAPDVTLHEVVSFFRGFPGLDAIGIASFGPLELRRERQDWGSIAATPKPGWSGIPLATRLAEALDVPVEIDTDVNGAALGEWRWGAGKGADPLVYITVGTGIGGGAVIGSRPLHGLVHPEIGHVSVPRHPDDSYPGRCPFHGDCLEGLAAGPAIQERWGRKAEDLEDLLPGAIELEAAYLGAGLRQVVYVLAPQRIVLGGGVGRLPGLVEAVGRRLVEEMAGYGVHPEHERGFVVPPGLGLDSGIAGALALAAGLE